MIIITGGAGFIGSAMLWALNRRGEENIIIIDDLGSTATEKWRNLSGLHFDDVIPIDLFPDLLERGALTGISAIIHMGAGINMIPSAEKFCFKQRHYRSES